MAKKNILKYILLGLIAQRDRTGYEIKNLFASEIGDFWSSNHSQIYPELLRMERTGLVASYVETVGTKLERKFYSITAQGDAALASWMEEPLGDLAPSRDEFTMKLYFVSDAKDPLARQLFEEDMVRHKIKLRYLKERLQTIMSEGRASHYGHLLILRCAIRRERERLAWLKEEYGNLPKESRKRRDH